MQRRGASWGAIASVFCILFTLQAALLYFGFQYAGNFERGLTSLRSNVVDAAKLSTKAIGEATTALKHADDAMQINSAYSQVRGQLSPSMPQQSYCSARLPVQTRGLPRSDAPRLSEVRVQLADTPPLPISGSAQAAER